MTNLYQYKDIKKEVSDIKLRISELERLRVTPRQSIITGVPMAPTHRHDKMDMDLIKLEELIKKYNELLNSLYEKQLGVEYDIEKLDPIERELIRYRYIDGMKWEDIQKKMFISQKTCFRIHRRAIDKLS